MPKECKCGKISPDPVPFHTANKAALGLCRDQTEEILGFLCWKKPAYMMQALSNKAITHPSNPLCLGIWHDKRGSISTASLWYSLPPSKHDTCHLPPKMEFENTNLVTNCEKQCENSAQATHTFLWDPPPVMDVSQTKLVWNPRDLTWQPHKSPFNNCCLTDLPPGKYYATTE